MSGFIHHPALIPKKLPVVLRLLAPNAGFTFMSV